VKGTDETMSISTIQWVDLSTILPNPQHPREGWDQVDDELQLLSSSLRDQGQREACRVTPIPPADPAYARGYRWLLADGHRRYVAAKRESLDLLVEVDVNEETGAPLRPLSVLSYWFMRHAGPRADTNDLIVCLARMRKAWDADHEGEDDPFPSVRDFAEAMGTSTAWAGKILQVANEPEPVVQAIATRILPIKAILLLIKEVSEPADRALLVQDLAAEQAKRTKYGQDALTVADIQGRITRVEVHSPNPPPRVVPVLMPTTLATTTSSAPAAHSVAVHEHAVATEEPLAQSLEGDPAPVRTLAYRARELAEFYTQLTLADYPIPLALRDALDRLSQPAVMTVITGILEG
jgi:ParB-like nuclease domain